MLRTALGKRAWVVTDFQSTNVRLRLLQVLCTLHREALPLRDGAASGPDGVTLLGIDHFSATKLVHYAWSLLLTRAAANDLRSWSNGSVRLLAAYDYLLPACTVTSCLLGQRGMTVRGMTVLGQ